jgi:sialate O-acetylesterase
VELYALETCRTDVRFGGRKILTVKTNPSIRKMPMKSLGFAAIWILLCGATALADEPKLAGVFSDHEVLQRNMAVPVWGTAEAGTEVVVEFAGQKKTATAGADGKWSLKLDPMPASVEPRELTLSESKNPAHQIVLKDILIGEVWIGSGQSNMSLPVSFFTANDSDLDGKSKATYPQLRLMTLPGPKWQQAEPASNRQFSALMLSFGIPLQKQLDIPVGLIVGAVGGSPSGFWLTDEMYRADPDCATVAKKFAETYDFDKEKAKYDEAKKKYDEEFAKWKPLADAAKQEGKPPPAPPRQVAQVVPAGEFSQGKIGNYYERIIQACAGYGIRGVLWDQGESGTAIVGVDQVTLMGALIRGWRAAWGQGDFTWLYVQKPSGGGCAWDYADPLHRLADKFAPLPKTIPAAPNDAYSHETFVRLMKYPNTFMATSSDLGSGLHPANKSAYGARAAQVALATVYNLKIEYLGPLYASHQIDDGKIAVSFTHVGKGLTFKNGERLQGFMIAGEDKKFVWADAVIEGDKVIVSSKDVINPVAVRYAWAATFRWANLFNQDGLPAQPFRTDQW